jgi:two-component system NarL family response regulator
VRTRCAGVKLVALSGYADKRFMQEMSKAGASGYIVKDSAGSNLARVIRAVAQGQPCWPPEIGIEGQSAASDRPL